MWRPEKVIQDWKRISIDYDTDFKRMLKELTEAFNTPNLVYVGASDGCMKFTYENPNPHYEEEMKEYLKGNEALRDRLEDFYIRNRDLMERLMPVA